MSGGILEQLRHGFAELTPHSDGIVLRLMMATDGHVDDRLQESAIGGTAPGPRAFDDFVSLEEFAAVNQRDPFRETVPFMLGERFRGPLTHDRVDSAAPHIASPKRGPPDLEAPPLVA